MLVLGIETSCDETAASVVKNGRTILSNVVATQIQTHKLYGGVVPEIASRQHLDAISLVVRQALEQAKLTIEDIDLIGATYGPGLIGSLLVGLSYGKALAFANNKPFVGVNHMLGHISTNYLETDLEPPFISMVVSGGHTYLIKVEDYDDLEVVGRTRDDAAGEAFDKVARTIGLGYPGGPYIDKEAKKGKATIDFPRVMIDDGYDFSFSGLKTAVLNYINSMNMKNQEISIPDLSKSFQDAVLDVLIYKVLKLSDETGIKTIAFSGGVSANQGLRDRMTNISKEKGLKIYFPDKSLSTDNGAMIAAGAFYEYQSKGKSPMDIRAIPNLGLE